MIRKIYHGSSQIVRSPKFGAGRTYNDFGLGFYCADSMEMAGEWAVGKSRNGFVSKYSINDVGLRVIDLGSPQFNILHWFSVLTNYRDFDTPTSLTYQGKEYIRSIFTVDYQSCDVLIGYRADNCNFMFAQEFLSGKITYEQLRHAVSGGNTGRQIVLKSNRAFDRVVFDGYEAAWSNEHFPAKVARDVRAVKRAISDPLQASGGLYISQILAEEIKPYDPRLS